MKSRKVRNPKTLSITLVNFSGFFISGFCISGLWHFGIFRFRDYKISGLWCFGILTIRDYNNSGLWQLGILMFRDLDCRDYMPSGFRASDFVPNPLGTNQNMSDRLRHWTTPTPLLTLIIIDYKLKCYINAKKHLPYSFRAKGFPLSAVSLNISTAIFFLFNFS